MSSREEQDSPQPNLNVVQISAEPATQPDSQDAAPVKLIKKASSFPVAEWDRYEFIEFIGEGGMGRVYKAKDPRLNRYVALKFIRGDDPELMERFLREAQAQALIEHKNVCKVYEVGEVEGRPYIAMQYIEGVSLKDAKAEMNLEQKLRTMKYVSEGLHEAHRLGMIHRDIKPSNIMAERDSEGRWIPYVMDFGLVRQVDAEGQTATGVIVGTPSYMSPEQARGESRKLDRRSDVYSLGATLYAALAGRPPFQGESGVEVVLKVLKGEPEPIRSIDADIPLDVETIVMKCLQKDRQLRYESAKALAEDLQRYLDGEPIKGRRASWTYWAAKKAKKHKAIVTTIALASIAVITLGGMGVYASLTAARQTELAQKFGQEVEKIDSIMRYAYMLPLHDVRREQTLVRLRMKKIEERINAIGRAAEGPGSYALGRGFLALRETEKAKEYFERALEKGYRTAEVNYALGQTLGALYQKELEAAERIGNKDLREARKKEIEMQYRAPALEYLRMSAETQAESPAYIEGLIAFYEKRYADALEKAETAFDQVPWLYEAKKLEGDVYVMAGNEKRDKGDYQGAKEEYERAGEAYRAAMEMAHSDETIYEGECEMRLQAMLVGRMQGGSTQEAFEQALPACDKALQADPESSEAYVKKSEIYWRVGSYQLLRGEDPQTVLEKAIEMGRLAVQWNPQSVNGYNNMGTAFETRGEYETGRGLDPRPSLDNAVESYQKAIQINPNFAAVHSNMGLAFMEKGKYEAGQGLDPRASLNRAIESYQKAFQINPNFANAYINIGIAYIRRGEYEIGKILDPRPSFDRAVESLQKAIQFNPNNASPYNSTGNAYFRKGEYETGLGLDPRPSLDRAVENYQKSIQINPNNPYAYSNLSGAYLRRGEYEIAQGLNPLTSLDRAAESSQKAIQLNPNNGVIYLTIGAVYWTKAQYLLEQKTNPEAVLNEGRIALQKSILINPNNFEVYTNQVSLELVAAQWAMRQNKSPKPFIEKAATDLEKALQLNPDDAEVSLTKAEIHFRRADWMFKNGETPKEDLRQGLEAIEKALSADGKSADALSIKGKLHLMQAQMETNPEKRTESAKRAAESIESAIQINKSLEKKEAPYLSEARRLSAK